MRRPKVGLVLGSGAARGWAHVGVLETLLESDIVPDVVCGTSMGALVGGLYASGRFDQLRDWALKADWRTIVSMVDVGLLSGGIVDGARIIKWLADLGGNRNIEDLDIPFAAVATDLTSGREIWLQSGPLDSAIRASIALPGIFSPVDLDDRWLVDGGLVNPVPVSLCRAMGADFIIAVRLNEDLLGRRLTRQKPVAPTPAKTEKTENLIDMVRQLPTSLRQQAEGIKLFGNGDAPGYFDVLANSINIMQDQITRSRLAGEPPHVQIAPAVAQIGLMDFDHAADAVAAGRAATEPMIKAIKARLSDPLAR